MGNHLMGILRRRCLDHGQFEAVVGQTFQGAVLVDEASHESAGLATTARLAIEAAQKVRLVLAHQQDARVAQGRTRRDRRQANDGTGTVHDGVLSLDRFMWESWTAVGGITEPAL